MWSAPLPRGTNNFIERARGFPLQQVLSARRIGHQGGRISRAAWRHSLWHRPSGNLLDRVEHFLYRRAAAASQIQSHRTTTIGKMFQREQVCLGQIGDVNVITDAGAIRCWIVRTVEFQFGSRSCDGLQRRRNQMSLRFVQFPDFSAVVASRSVEVTQSGKM